MGAMRHWRAALFALVLGGAGCGGAPAGGPDAAGAEGGGIDAPAAETGADAAGAADSVDAGEDAGAAGRDAAGADEATDADDADDAIDATGPADVVDAVDPGDAAGATDSGGVCPAGQTRCGTRCVNTQTSIENCGACGAQCPLHPTATTVCSAGQCGLECLPGLGDCDGDPTDGCETDLLHDAAHCSACGSACPAPDHASASCGNGACDFRCDALYGDCNVDAADGCETALTAVDNCGACGTACTTAPPHATPACDSAGTCRYACMPGYAACDLDDANGCECGTTRANMLGRCGLRCNSITGCPCEVVCAPGAQDCDADPTNGCNDLQTDPSNCGACGHVCPQPSGTNMVAACAGGVCGAQCALGYGDCNGSPSDGCEVHLNGTFNCGACRAACFHQVCCADRNGSYYCANSCP